MKNEKYIEIPTFETFKHRVDEEIEALQKKKFYACFSANDGWDFKNVNIFFNIKRISNMVSYKKYGMSLYLINFPDYNIRYIKDMYQKFIFDILDI